MPQQTTQQITTENFIFDSQTDKDLVRTHPKLMIKLNHMFKDMGFKSIVTSNDFNEFTAKEKMTLSIKPNIIGLPFDFLSLGDRIINLSGYNGSRDYLLINSEREKIDVEITGSGYSRGRKFEIASYFPERNIMVLDFDIFSGTAYTNSEKEEDNQLMFLMINGIKKWIEENKDKFKEKDIKEFVREMLERKFSKVIVENIRLKEIRTKELEQNINSNYNHISEFSREVVSNKKELIGLTKVRKEIKGNFIEKLNVIKTLPFVKDFKITEKGISVDVGKISIGKVDIGEFTIHILPNRITATNKTPLHSEFIEEDLHHPHVNESSFCLGVERKKKILELLAQNKFKEAVFMAYLSLKNYNETDSYYNIKFWTEEDYNPENNEDD